MKQGQISKLTGGLYTIVEPNGMVWEAGARGIFRNREESPLVGDFVDFEEADGYKGVITTIHSRKNCFIRPPLANLDCMVLVVATADPAPNLLVIDKFLVAMSVQALPVLFAVTKADLAPPHTITDIYRKAGYTVFVMDTVGEGRASLKRELQGKLAAFSGNSGVGKSSLLNQLDAGLQLPIGATSQKLGRGKHTTRHTEIMQLAGGLRIADTAGFSSLDILQTANIPPQELAAHFHEFADYSDHCRFRDCTHQKEAGCAVRQACEAAEIAPSRYRNYLQLYKELDEVKHWERK